MPPDKRPLLRLAMAIHGQYTRDHAKQRPIELPADSWNRCRSLERRMRTARSRGWLGAARRVRRDLASALDQLRRDSQTPLVSLNQPEPPAVKLSDIYKDLVSLYDDFPSVDFNLQDKTLSVATDTIVLEDVDLGSFEIRLHWRDLPPTSYYDVIAKDPQPATANEKITHPHVSEEALCEGEAQMPLQHALAEGRLLDFFQVVNQVLQTYNSASAYVTLDEWSGCSCPDCGESMSEDDSVNCSNCETFTCRYCSSWCKSCDNHFCGDCISSCGLCSENCCCGCLRSCQTCNVHVCSDCQLLEERCQLCHAEEPEEEFPDAEPAVQSHGLGQVAVPA